MPCVRFQNLPAPWRSLPHSRNEAKNQTLSCLIGPPTEKVPSQTLTTSFTVVRPLSRSSSVRLLICSLLPLNRPEALPLNVFPPSLGTMFATGPSALLSAEIPLVDSVTSSVSAVFGV